MDVLKRLSIPMIGLGVLLILIAILARPATATPQFQPNGNDKTVYLPLIKNGPPAFIDHAGRRLPYEGASTCESCHSRQVHDFTASNHYLWNGKLGAMNDFCGYPDINLGPSRLTTVSGTQVDGGCAVCHAGLGEKPTATNGQNADCLMCHASQYKRIAVDVGGGVYRFRPNLPAMPATITLQREPARSACLTCHASSGGGDNNKRGDMSAALANPTQNQDVHMGSGMVCTDCHTAASHKIAGRGVDLIIDEGVPMRACADCHTPSSDHNNDIVRHLDKVACQSCHIPAYARVTSTDMLRDYHTAEVNSRGLYEPKITRGANVIPKYAFWNGQSGFYTYRSAATSGQLMAYPLGDVNDGKLYPFKLHQAWMPQDLGTRAILPVKSGILFQTGNMDAAIRAGAQAAGFDLSQGYTFVDVQRWMGIFHEMPPANQALTCANCHNSTARIDFAALGYTPRTTRNGQPLCTSCHDAEDFPGFYAVHREHVNGEQISCDVCHTIAR